MRHCELRSSTSAGEPATKFVSESIESYVYHNLHHYLLVLIPITQFVVLMNCSDYHYYLIILFNWHPVMDSLELDLNLNGGN